MKQTAVEWLISKLIEHGDLKENWRSEQFFNQAKQMDKEQKLEVSKAGCFSTFEFEQYYNETYNT
jgi:hypothetical protein